MRGIAWWPSDHDAFDDMLQHAISVVCRRVPIAVHIDPLVRNSTVFRTLAAIPTSVDLTLEGPDDRWHGVQWLSSGADARCEGAMIQALGQRAHSAIDDLLLVAIRAGRRRLSVAEFSVLCKQPVRTVQYHFKASGSLGPRELLASILCLHSCWCLEVEHCQIKRAASEAGFASAADFSNYLRRHTGKRPLEIQTKGWFWCGLRELTQALSRHSPAERALAYDVGPA